MTNNIQTKDWRPFNTGAFILTCVIAFMLMEIYGLISGVVVMVIFTAMASILFFQLEHREDMDGDQSEIAEQSQEPENVVDSSDFVEDMPV